MKLQKYNKLWVALLASGGVLLFACAPDEATHQLAFVVTRNEWFQVLVAFAGAGGVYQIRNKEL